MTFFNWTTLQLRTRRAAQAMACALIVMVAATGLTPSIVYAQANTAQPARVQDHLVDSGHHEYRLLVRDFHEVP